MKYSTQPKNWVRIVNGIVALAFASFVLINYWPLVKLFDLARADLQCQGEWIGGHAKRITVVTPAGVADRAGLKAGDVLEFDPGRDSDWVLAGYRNMPEAFSGTLSVRHETGIRSAVALAPERVEYLPTLNDRLALIARLAGLTFIVSVGVALVWARPGIMTWSLLLATVATAPAKVWSTYFLAFDAEGSGLGLTSVIVGPLITLTVFNLPFALNFPRSVVGGWPRWMRALGLGSLLVLAAWVSLTLYTQPFAQDTFPPRTFSIWTATSTLITFAALMVLVHTYGHAGAHDRARLKWALLGIAGGLAVNAVAAVFIIRPFNLANPVGGGALSPAHWTIGIVNGFVFPLALGYAVLRERVIDVQFAVSRTVVYGLVSTIVLLFLAVLHWLLGRMIEHSGFAFGVEGLAAVGLGLVLHRASHGINRTVDRVLFRRHHAAEERLRQVTVALPFARTEQSIAEAIVLEPTRNLALASAALFYRESSEGPLKRVLAVGWGESHAESLDAESLLVRYLQADHTALRLNGEQEWLPTGMPEGSAHPVLAIPIVTQHVLTAVVLYGAHVNATLPDPDEVVLLEALAKAAATSHQQVRISMLQREKTAADRKAAAGQARIEEQERTIARLETLAQVRLGGAQRTGNQAEGGT